MVHSLSSRAHGQALFGQAQAGRLTLQLDGSRIAANAGAIAINAVALLLLLSPMAPPPMAPLIERNPDVVLITPKVEPIKPIEVPIVDRPKEQKPRPDVMQPHPTPPHIDPPQVDSLPGDIVAPPLDSVTHADTDVGIDEIPPAAASAHLQTIAAPPPSYPPEAVREGLTGTVELEILVGIDGKPLEVRVVRSSGHRALDQAARKVVLTRWSFVPAMQNGQQVQALGRVPIVFKLDR